MSYLKFLSLSTFVFIVISCGSVPNRQSGLVSDQSSDLVHSKTNVDGVQLIQPSSIATNSRSFECLLGRLSWFGNLKVEFRVTGLFDDNHRLGRVRMARLPGAPTRYDVVQQSKIDPSSNTMLSLQLVHEDNAGYYESTVTVSNQKFQGPTDDFNVEDQNSENFYKAKYVWRDLHRNESTGVGVCYIPSAN